MNREEANKEVLSVSLQVEYLSIVSLQNSN